MTTDLNAYFQSKKMREGSQINKKSNNLNSVTDVALIKVPCHCSHNGELVVLEGLSHVPFAIARVFIVRAEVHSIRGQHAHKECTQFLICSSGSIEVDCDDGSEHITFVIDKPNIALLIPPGIWAQETYKEENSVLTVLCDQAYSPDDYIFDYSEFIQYRETYDLLGLKQEKR